MLQLIMLLPPLNTLQPRDHYSIIYCQFDVQKSYVLPTQCFCVSSNERHGHISKVTHFTYLSSHTSHIYRHIPHISITYITTQLEVKSSILLFLLLFLLPLLLPLPLLLRLHYSPMRTFAFSTDFSQSAPTVDLSSQCAMLHLYILLTFVCTQFHHHCFEYCM
jgi:hypothetical protein